ncbi:MAG TPA: PIN domain-containing protein, partial [Ktedonobacterales bacterium]|nr:PIN domain-containing protein [Ktedonobacterales bacterium]
MSGRTIVRAVAFVVATAAALDVGFSISNARPLKVDLPWEAVVGGALVIGIIAVVATPLLIIAPYRWLRELIRKAEVSDLIAGVVGLIVGLLIAALLAFPLAQVRVFDIDTWAPSVVALICGYLGAAVAVMRRNDFSHLVSLMFAGRAARRAAREAQERDGEERDDHEEPGAGRLRGFGASKKNARNSDKILVDTSAIIDGRIADICQTGFVNGTLVIPRFVLEELQHIADSADSLRRNRGRRGLEILQRLQKDEMVPVEISDADADTPEVDAKLVKLARQWRCPIITNDFNLNRVAELQGVKVLNINELAHAVKPILLPGEDMVIKIMQDGKEAGQGVGYLDDGTMIVVENGRAYMNSTIEVTVTRVLQTVAGRMIFA